MSLKSSNVPSTNLSYAINQSNGSNQSAGTYKGGIWAALRYLLKPYTVALSFTVSIMILVILLVFGLLSHLDGQVEVWRDLRIALPGALSGGGSIFMFVMGICMQLSLTMMVTNGITRKQYAQAELIMALGSGIVLTTVLAIALLILDVTVLEVLPGCPFASSMPLALLSILLTHLLNYSFGFLIALGFQYKRIVTAAGSILAVILISNIIVGPIKVVSGAGDSLINQLFGYEVLTPSLMFVLIIAFTAALTAFNLRFAKGIPLKC